MTQTLLAPGTGDLAAPADPRRARVARHRPAGRSALRTALGRGAPDVLATLAGGAVLARLGAGEPSLLVALLLWPLLLTAAGATRLRAVPGTRRLQCRLVLRTAAYVGLLLWVADALVALPVAPGPLVATTATLAGVSLLLRLPRWAAQGSRLLVVGETRQVLTALEELRRTGRDLAPVGVCVLGAEPLPAQEAYLDLGPGLESVPAAAARCGAEAVLVLPGPEVGTRDAERLGWHLGPRGVQLYLGTGLLDVAAGRTAIAEVNGLRLVHLRSLPAAGTPRLVKTVAERLAAALLLLVLLPLMLAVAVAVRLDSPGPALFRQRRVGRDGRLFTMYKFRTMREAAEERLAALADRDEGAGVLFKIRQDPRVTRTGTLLRRWSLDELPQLLNVARGDMALVGPRPALPQEVARYEADPRRRLAVKPGLTGLWQVSGRSDLSWTETVRLDLRYVDNWSLRLDLAILCRTVGAVLGRRGAY